MGDLFDRKINDPNYSIFTQRNWFGFYPIFDVLFVLPYRIKSVKSFCPIRPSGKYREIFSSISLIAAVIIFSGKDLSHWWGLAQSIISKEGIVVMLILSFALLSYGLKRSKYFDYIAYRLIEKCGGSTSKLIIYMFIITSLLTLFTSNDIVILVLTPIILKMLRMAKIKNARLILLSQFVAANTLSMALIFGSPTNLFYALDKFPQENAFMQYLLLMIVPTVIVFMTTLIIIDWINGKSFKYWEFEESYTLPDFSEKISFDRKRMMPWLILALASIVSLGFTTSAAQNVYYWFENPLLISLIITLLGYLIITIRSHSKEIISWQNTVKTDLFTEQGVPWQILFFALSFFLVGHEVALITNNLEFATDFILLYDNKPWHLFSSIITSVFGVNIVNDLPASVMLSKLSFDLLDERIINIGILVGLNIGTYLTPIGALAGMMWFHELGKKEPGDFELKIPTRQGLFKYGMIVITGSIIALTFILPELFNIYDWLVMNSEVFFVNGIYLMAAALLLVFFINYVFNGVVSKHFIALNELNIILGIHNSIHRFTHNNIVKTYMIVLSLVLVLLLLPVWLIEHSLNPGLDLNKFLINAPGMIGVGMDVDTAVIKLQSPYGKMIMGILPIIAISLVVWVMSTINKSSDVKSIRSNIAKGNGGGHRVFIIGSLSLIEPKTLKAIYSAVIYNKDVFFTFIVRKSEVNSVLDHLVYDKIFNTYVDHYVTDFSDLVLKYKVDNSEEIFFLGDDDDFIKLAKEIETANKIKLITTSRKARLFNLSSKVKNAKNYKFESFSTYYCSELKLFKLIQALYSHSEDDIIDYKNYTNVNILKLLQQDIDEVNKITNIDIVDRIKEANTDAEALSVIKSIEAKLYEK
jgi:arsenical pump membrane protein